MNNKQYREYKAKIRAKLLEMGIKDESVPVVSARKPSLSFNPATGEVEQKLVPRHTFQNLNRRITSQLLDNNPSVALIESFLAADPNALKTLFSQNAEQSKPSSGNG